MENCRQSKFKIINHQLFISDKCSKELTEVNSSMNIVRNTDERSKREQQYFTCNTWNVNPQPPTSLKQKVCAIKHINEILFSQIKVVLLFVATRRNYHKYICYVNSLAFILPNILRIHGHKPYSSIIGAPHVHSAFFFKFDDVASNVYIKLSFLTRCKCNCAATVILLHCLNLTLSCMQTMFDASIAS